MSFAVPFGVLLAQGFDGATGLDADTVGLEDVEELIVVGAWPTCILSSTGLKSCPIGEDNTFSGISSM